MLFDSFYDSLDSNSSYNSSKIHHGTGIVILRNRNRTTSIHFSLMHSDRINSNNCLGGSLLLGAFEEYKGNLKVFFVEVINVLRLISI